MDAAALRAAFPVLARTAYLNAGSCGPLPHAGITAAQEITAAAERDGRARAYFETTLDLRERLRAAYAARLSADPADVALTTSTSEGVVRVLAGLGLRAGDEVLTAPDEHPGLLGPLVSLRERRGVDIRTAPFERLADAVSARTRLVACSHVSWTTGAVAPAAVAGLPDDLPLLLDGAQGVGAVAVDPVALGASFYAGAGQKWLCGPVGTGMLWIASGARDRVAELGATYGNLENPAAGLHATPRPDARRHDTPALSAEHCAAALAAHDVLEVAGWDDLLPRASALAAGLAAALAERGRTIAPRGATTLVSWEDADPGAAVARAAQAGVVIRELPGTPYVRASVGAWNDEDDLERLLAVA